MLDFAKALNIAREEIKKKDASGELSLELQTDLTIETDFGWIFFYNSKEYIQSGDIIYSLAGNAPFIVDKFDASVHSTGTAHPLEFYVEKYRREKI